MAVVAYNSGLDIERMFAVAQNLTFDTNNEGNFCQNPTEPQKCSILKIEHQKILISRMESNLNESIW